MIPVPSKDEIEGAFEDYNKVAERIGLPKAHKLSPVRRRIISARLRDHGPDGWRRALEQLEASAFLRGNNDRGWVATLDFMCQPRSFDKLIDGAYRSSREQQQEGDTAVKDDNNHNHDHEDDGDYVGLYDLAGAIEDVVRTAAPDKRAGLYRAIEDYHRCNGEDFHWVVSDRAPALVSTLFRAIHVASMPEAASSVINKGTDND